MTVYKSKYRSLGRIYKKSNRRPDGTRVDHLTWTVRHKGRDHATGETDAKKAEQFLLTLAGDKARADVAEGAAPLAGWRKKLIETQGVVTMNQVLDLGVAGAKRKGNRTAKQTEQIFDLHHRPFFGHVRADGLTSSHIEDYQDMRLSAGAKPATVNRETALLRRALNLALKRDPPLIDRFPKIEKLRENNVRTGFLRHNQYQRLLAALPPHVAPILVAGYHVGNRKGELLQIELQDIELDAPTPQFRLYPEACKNGEGRVIPIYGTMLPLFKRLVETTQRDYPGCTWLFNKNGRRIQSFYKTWKTALDKAQLPGFYFHDLRRCAVRNLTRAGIGRKDAMAITGHKTENVYERYNIVDEADMAAATALIGDYMNQLDQQNPLTV